MLLQDMARQIGQTVADTGGAALSPTLDATDHSFQVVFGWLRLGVETIGALVIAAGVLVGVVQFVRTSFQRTPDGYTDVRLRLARFLAVALEFQLGADLLSTAIAPSWYTIRNLAAIAIIRTGLNYFLGKEMNEEAARLNAAGATPEQATRRASGSAVTPAAATARSG